MKSTKIKIFVGLICLCLVAIVAIVAVWAGTNSATPTSSFTIKYNAASSVRATLSGSFSASNGTVASSLASIQDVTIDETNSTGELDFGVLTLTPDATAANQDGKRPVVNVVITITNNATNSQAQPVILVYIKGIPEASTNTTRNVSYTIDGVAGTGGDISTIGTEENSTIKIQKGKSMVLTLTYTVTDCEQGIGTLATNNDFEIKLTASAS